MRGERGQGRRSGVFGWALVGWCGDVKGDKVGFRCFVFFATAGEIPG